MSNDQTLEYFRRRERAERDAAATAQCEDARRIHLDLAERYACLVREAGQVPPGTTPC